ncbi:adenosylcobinamide kinase /adenosylcobinamide-phosphate guanylyltransferase [Arcicella aurantiaca]|uniref:Adenosylcobinamide kinase n=1 Tax=Arcicella aurantiaca TaxID=591202 RepID=A0A316DGN8_9BACT|nr:bifunctional adenosylcobinamide kinase/adenosylcobinamide-phosphate guanylyltransferase [Arcicella aurantiaca]PWK17304.1 adenosylcobinamide kinase /adenosylcobinamide-phosphate guanylyltransferase [Arcicella aurantiaca]
MIWMITGGARSGKSSFAQNLALSFSQSPIYVATAQQWDDDFQERIKRHQSDRDERWTTIEEQMYIGSLPIDNQTIVLDCATLWLTNFFIEEKYNIDICLEKAKIEIDLLADKEGNFIFITNELGMGVHAETAMGRKFTDLQGWVNQYLASKATKVTLMVSGIPVTIK